MATQQTASYEGSRSAEWYTERRILDHVITVLGAIDLDPCSNPAPYNVPATTHYTAAQDGLGQPWFGRVFMNPPYGREVGKWVEKLLSEIHGGHVAEAIVLIPARVETAWFAGIWQADTICFIRGRLHFAGESVTAHNAPFASVLAYFGYQPKRFGRVFRDIGKIIYKESING